MRRKILFVDDEPNVLEGLERLLHDYSSAWNMTFVDNAAAALDLLMCEAHEVAVLDIKMPGMSGLELLAKIKSSEATRDVEVIMLTGLKDLELKRWALDLGAADLLSKPVLREDLVARLNSALRVREFRDELKARNALLEEQLLQSQRMEAVGVLAAGIAHDLNNILTAMLGYGELTERTLPEDTSARAHVQHIQAAGQRARKLVEQIVRFTAGDASGRERCELGTVITECLELLRPTLPETVDVEWAKPDAEYVVMADSTQMYQIVMNLCLNASQAMKHGGVMTVSLSDGGFVSEVTEPQGKTHPSRLVQLVVADTGVGMDETALQNAFEPLFSTKHELGTGLGLSVVDRIVKNHGGSITLESGLGEGTTVSVALPAAFDTHTEALTIADTTDELCKETGPVR